MKIGQILKKLAHLEAEIEAQIYATTVAPPSSADIEYLGRLISESENVIMKLREWMKVREKTFELSSKDYNELLIEETTRFINKIDGQGVK